MKKKETLERVEKKMESQIETIQKGMNDRKAQALIQCTGKWQRAIDEMQTRFEIEKKCIN